MFVQCFGMASLKNAFTLICTLLTLFLICQEVVTYSIKRPTTTSQEEKELEVSDLPDVVMCLDPALNLTNIAKYGYNNGFYYRGSVNGTDFIGWNGNATHFAERGKGNFSAVILNKALVFDGRLQQQLVKEAYYRGFQNESVKAKMRPRTLMYPYGRCLAISPPTETNVSHPKINTLQLTLRTTDLGFDTKSPKTRIRIYLMDKLTSAHIYPNGMELMGSDRIPAKKLYADPEIQTFKTKITRTQHVPGDPLFNCDVYTEENTYNDCIQSELLEIFDREIGCQPPLLAKDPNLMCNKIFNVSTNKAEKIKNIFQQLYIANMDFKCRTPCETSKFTTQNVHTTKNGDHHLIISFDKKVEVVRSTFKIDEQTFLARLGGSISSGRTVLWLLVGLLGAFQVIFTVCSCKDVRQILVPGDFS